MNLYRISQKRNNDWDTYDSAVVCAESEADARMVHPNGEEWDGAATGDWVAAADVTVDFVGIAREGIARSVICASFNAG